MKSCEWKLRLIETDPGRGRFQGSFYLCATWLWTLRRLFPVSPLAMDVDMGAPVAHTPEQLKDLIAGPGDVEWRYALLWPILGTSAVGSDIGALI